MTIIAWLREDPHGSVLSPETRVVSEVSAITDDVRRHLTLQLIAHRARLDVARDLTRALGWGNAQRRFQPRTIQVSRGDFGEMLAGEVLEAFGAVVIPVRKVRYQMHADETMIGADIVALQLDGDEVVSLHFGEAKLRTTADTAAGEDAHEQLRAWHENEFADILWFVGARLEEQDPGLYRAFVRYLGAGDDRADQFHIILVWEATNWTDTVLTNIPSPPDRLEPLLVRTVLVGGLAELVDSTYGGIQGELTNGG